MKNRSTQADCTNSQAFRSVSEDESASQITLTAARTSKSMRRRGVVFALASGAALGWHKPVVDSLMLPAHAQTSVDSPMSGSSGTGFAGSGSGSSGAGSSTSGSGSSGTSGGGFGSGSSGSSAGTPSSSGSSSSGSSASSGSGSTSSGSGAGSGGGSSSGSGSTGSSSGGGSSGSSGGGGGPKVEPKQPSVTATTLSGGACVSGCQGSTALLMVDIYDSNADLIGSYETTRPIAGDACVEVTVKPGMYGINSKVWPRGYMFVIAVTVPRCGLSDQVSGFF